ncbi:MAG: hypothetical protein JWO38_5134 [Gemmataceae bacterium]|nr:hypothetical protein [Gemmataceae bacterium]
MSESGMIRDAQERAADGVLSGSSESDTADVPAWEQIEAGRFMPRRIRGSFRGGKLG